MDFADFMKGAAPAAPAAPAAVAAKPPAKRPVLARDWPIVTYQAIGEAIPDEPFIAYVILPQNRGKVMVRCGGLTEEAARAAAQAWIDNEVAKLLRAEERAKSLKKST